MFPIESLAQVPPLRMARRGHNWRRPERRRSPGSLPQARLGVSGRDDIYIYNIYIYQYTIIYVSIYLLYDDLFTLHIYIYNYIYILSYYILYI